MNKYDGFTDRSYEPFDNNIELPSVSSHYIIDIGGNKVTEYTQ